MDFDFKELSNDSDIVDRLREFIVSVDEIQEILKFIENPEFYQQLSNMEKIKFNLLMSFSMNSLFWMYLRAEGIDPMNHQIKAENERLKESMARAKQIHDRNTKMPRINKDVAKRFIKHELWDPKSKSENLVENIKEAKDN
ncbi:PREDICTED: nuclear nucleic acid-binding protein C1D-like [Ceratosolen solmsi marchali]|uniref:Nuclear nucleic acid-binding protein C1D n=1 Tax=Ceratosolen solmsi marchali TaxID=326594 RepID=A0AAJ6YUG2_9HYME|nr:PREDICTED: nuclear nucleic acid-binding protein C1D-like [Ceratosolen solmsi marchali]